MGSNFWAKKAHWRGIEGGVNPPYQLTGDLTRPGPLAQQFSSEFMLGVLGCFGQVVGYCAQRQK